MQNVGRKGRVCGSLSPRPAGSHRQDGRLGASVVAPHCGMDLSGVPLLGNQVWGRNLGIQFKRGCQTVPIKVFWVVLVGVLYSLFCLGLDCS